MKHIKFYKKYNLFEGVKNSLPAGVKLKNDVIDFITKVCPYLRVIEYSSQIFLKEKDTDNIVAIYIQFSQSYFYISQGFGFDKYKDIVDYIKYKIKDFYIVVDNNMKSGILKNENIDVKFSKEDYDIWKDYKKFGL